MNQNFCHYGGCKRGRLCCWLCDLKQGCRYPCTLPCDKYRAYQARPPAVIIHYAAKNKAPDDCWRDITGVILIMAKGKGPRNVLVKTEQGTVVVPRLNVRWMK